MSSMLSSVTSMRKMSSREKENVRSLNFTDEQKREKSKLNTVEPVDIVAARARRWLSGDIGQLEDGVNVQYVPKGTFASVDMPELSDLEMLCRAPRARLVMAWLCENVRTEEYIEMLKGNARLELALSSGKQNTQKDDPERQLVELEALVAKAEKENEILEQEIMSLSSAEVEICAKTDQIVADVIRTNAVSGEVSKLEENIIQVVTNLRQSSNADLYNEELQRLDELNSELRLALENLSIQFYSCGGKTESGESNLSLQNELEREVGEIMLQVLTLRRKNKELQLEIDSMAGESNMKDVLQQTGKVAAAQSCREIVSVLESKLAESSKMSEISPQVNSDTKRFSSHDIGRVVEKINADDKCSSFAVESIIGVASQCRKSAQTLTKFSDTLQDLKIEILRLFEPKENLQPDSKQASSVHEKAPILITAIDFTEQTEIHAMNREMKARYEAGSKGLEEGAVLKTRQLANEVELALSQNLKRSVKLKEKFEHIFPRTLAETEQSIKEWWGQPGQHVCNDLIKDHTGKSYASYIEES